jgi:chromosome segregation protein
VFLKALTLKGFKSFADTTTLEFEPGVMVVVGPNGSGKSNVVDAVAWVLGAQGPRTVRSGKMEDVIFAGTSSRPALGRAEVSLTIDNSSGLLPIELAEVTITRTLFRSGDSEYALNGAPCRLLDVQELLSDTGVGRQQHVIVGQGQLDSVLNARPEDRRLIIEEAAGVLKYRRRRERSQRRLDATEANLTRLSDLLREVRRQLRPLERQAEAARRHAELADEVRALRLHVAGLEVAALEGRLAAAGVEKERLAGEEGDVRTRLSALDADVMVAERAMSASASDGGLADAVGELEGARARARGVLALLSERRRSLERDLLASRDEGVVASLEADAATLGTQLAEVEVAAQSLIDESARVASAEQAADRARAAFEQRWGDDRPSSPGPGPAPEAGLMAPAGPAPATAAEARVALAGHRTAAVRDEQELERLSLRRQVLVERREAAAAEAGGLRAGAEGGPGSLAAVAAARERSAARLAEATAAHEAADAAHREADRRLHSLRARAEALAQALDEAVARAGVERLAGLPGVIGTLAELVEVDDGWESAFEAAAGEALSAVVVEDREAARAALGRLRSQGQHGAVLPLGLLRASSASAGPDGPSLPEGAGPIRAHVRSRDPRVDALLDAIVGATAAVEGDWEAALDAVADRPEMVAVSRAGDRFAPAAWRTGAAGNGATGAALEEARRRESQARSALETSAAELGERRLELDDATRSDREGASALSATQAAERSNQESLERLERLAADSSSELESLDADLGSISPRVDFARAAAAAVQAVLPELEAREAAADEEASRHRDARQEAERLRAAAATLKAELEVRAAGIEERRSILGARLLEVEGRLRAHVEERQKAAGRRTRLEASLVAVGRLSRSLESRTTGLEEVLAELRERRRTQAEGTRAAAAHLDDLRLDRGEAERALERIREHAQRNSLEETEARLRLEARVETIRRDLECEPEVAKAAPCPELAPGTSAPGRLRDLDRELRMLGPINPLALEEFAGLEERHRFLDGQLDDVRASRRELSKVIRAIDTEIVEVFAAAYADVSSNFEKLFSTLFPGGAGRIRLTDPDNLLETGVEIEGRPSGKNVKRLSLLSGGERSLTAIAFLFAVFRSRPSPFYLMDEVEAALDDVNLHRFLDLISDFRQEAQLVVVSHQKRTMEAADCLYGVTMQPGGSSKVVSEKVSAGV